MKEGCSMVDLNEFLETNAVDNINDRVYKIDNDEAIVDYLYDTHGSKILTDFDHRQENTGVAMFFHCPVDCRDLVIVMRMKYFKKDEENGLFMIVFRKCHEGRQLKKDLIEFLTDCLGEGNPLTKETIQCFDGHVMKAVQVNA